ncbi:small integral membrane protein 20-like [Anneissia japonica]|uniref:small integral membrane protein 20-like n=1 Tax=Anneissia japonica TaxID=1529436 RepID=UPI0014258699|nr:small integral membrane protein 20-like [Anneissia japonica]XP_033106019.1 small integral membrane protein 20-like [Anneissia japonica]
MVQLPRSGFRNRNGIIISCFVGLVGVALYPIIIQPYFNPKPWQNTQKEARKDINQEDIQPGGMRVWSDPFAPRADIPKK